MTKALTGIGTLKPSRSRASSSFSRARAGALNSLSTGISIVPSNSAVTVNRPMWVRYQPGPFGTRIGARGREADQQGQQREESERERQRSHGVSAD